MARPIAQDYQNKRKAILKAAARLIADEGYGRASMAEIAKACNISKANIYHYYDGKDALLFDILDTHLSDLRDLICGLNFPTTDPADQLRDIITAFLIAYQGADAEHAVQLNALSALPEPQQRVLKQYQREMVRVVRDRVARLTPSEISDSPSTLHSLTMSVFALVNWHYRWNGDADETARKTYANLISDLIVGGLPTLNTLHEIPKATQTVT